MNHINLGDAGEFLTLFHLAKNGYKAHHVPAIGYDIIVETDYGLKRLSVKTRSKNYTFKAHVEVGRNGSIRGKNVDIKKYADLIACVSIDLERVIFVDTETIENDSIYIKPSKFFDGCERATLESIQFLKPRAPAIINDLYQFDLF